MKVLYIGNYNDQTGWGDAALNNILALDSAGVDVVPRSISFNNSHIANELRIKQLELNSTKGCDICIQHTLPNLYSYHEGLKNIGVFYTETLTFTESMWHKHINLLDEVWVANSQMAEACQKSLVNIPVSIAPLSLDIADYGDRYKDCATMDNIESTFNFCFVGEMIHRKNIEGLLRAFHTEFHPSEPVNLFLKVTKSGYNSQDTLSYFEAMAANVKRNLKIRDNYKEEVVVSGHLEKRHLKSLMAKCNCFVMPSFGEAWCIPALEAMALAMPVIYTKGTGMDDFCYGWSVDSRPSPCYGATDSLGGLYTSKTKWVEPDIESLASCMRVAFETYKNSPQKYSEMQQNARSRAVKYDRLSIGRKLKELLQNG
tara:strand:- start:677 stop:1789 length:1113 start_codon:yes stop_codon:yes gene_type:complete